MGGRRLLLLGGGLVAGLAAFEVGGAAFTFDVLVELLAHGCWKYEGSTFSEYAEGVKRGGGAAVPPFYLAGPGAATGAASVSDKNSLIAAAIFA